MPKPTQTSNAVDPLGFDTPIFPPGMVTKKTSIAGIGPSKEFEKIFDKVMNPSKYQRKYGHKDKQVLMPPSYICKKPKNSKKELNHEDFLMAP
jgi:hypothetical protein